MKDILRPDMGMTLGEYRKKISDQLMKIGMDKAHENGISRGRTGDERFFHAGEARGYVDAAIYVSQFGVEDDK